MPKVLIDATKGLVQSAGSGFGIAASSESYGVYSFIKEISLADFTPGTDKEHLAAICTVPASSVVLRAFIVCSEDVAPNNSALKVDLAATTSTVTSAAVTEANLATIINDANLKDDDAGDHVSSVQS